MYLTGDACNVGFATDPRGTAHVIGAAIFRSPEALLGLKWSTPTDIWSFGATASLVYTPPLTPKNLAHPFFVAHQSHLGAKFPHFQTSKGLGRR